MGIKRAWSFSSFELLISTLAQVGKLTRAIIFPKSFSQQKQAVFYCCLGLVKKQNVKKGSNGERMPFMYLLHIFPLFKSS